MVDGRALLSTVGGWLREPPALLALGFNLAPAVCVLLFGWSPAILLLLYWAENVVIGVFQIFRMLCVAGRDGPASFFVGLFGVAFFVVHYGMFCLGHGLFALTFLGFEMGIPNNDEMTEKLLLDLPRILVAESGFTFSLAAIVALQAVTFGQWVLARGWRTVDESKLMGEPYGRIIALHVSLFAMTFGLLALGSPVIGVFALALLKTIAEGAFAGRKAKAAKAAGSS